MADISTPNFPSNIEPIALEEEMKKSYLDYAMSVIVSRALPDVRDGLKPVHRRILFGMYNGGFRSTAAFKKSAKIVGEVMGNYHPHGDQSIYDALVRMVQNFSMRVPLIDGQGNFGSLEDNAAAMRYTEARLAKVAETALEDIDEDTVDFRPSYDGSMEEPTVLPARFPILLVNGTGGIAVGMATNIPPHNLGEIIDATVALVAEPSLTIEDLMKIVPGPDFPTGGVIMGRAGIRAAYTGGRGSIVLRAKATIEEMKGERTAIVVEEMPYQVSREDVQERLKALVTAKELDGFAAMRDETSREGTRLVFELKRDAVPDVALNQLYKHTQLQTSFGVNMLALHKGVPQTLNLKDILQAFIDFRIEVITRRTRYRLRQARERAHILIGLAVAVANIDEIIALIRAAPDANAAREALTTRRFKADSVASLIELINEPGHRLAADGTYLLSEAQAKAILELRLQRLTGLEREKISNELNEVAAAILELIKILSDRSILLELLVSEMQEIRTKFATPRRTEIMDSEYDSDIEDLIPREDMVITVSHAGYIKRVPLDTYRAQARGGKGRSGMTTKDEDFVTNLFVANTHSWLLFFTNRGMSYRLKVYKLPEGNPQARGKALVNLLPLQVGERVSAVMPMPDDENALAEMNIIFATSLGNVRRNKLSDFGNIRSNGLIAIKMDEGENLIGVQPCLPTDHILLSTANGRAIRFAADDVRVFAGRDSNGVRGIRLGADDHVIALSILTGTGATAEERTAYMKQANALRRQDGEEIETDTDVEEEESTSLTLSPERFAQLQTVEQFVLTITARGYGKLVSAYAYRTTGRGGQGITNLKALSKVGHVMSVLTAQPDQQIMLATNGGQLIRLPIKSIRITGRAASGVILFRINEGERVVSAELVAITGEEDIEEAADVVESIEAIEATAE